MPAAPEKVVVLSTSDEESATSSRSTSRSAKLRMSRESKTKLQRGMTAKVMCVVASIYVQPMATEVSSMKTCRR